MDKKLIFKKGFRPYDIWCGMRQRCHNPKNKRYKYYGAKGITITKDWENFDTFYHWAINNGYSDTLTIDRKDSEKDYSPENCRWITAGENTIHAHLGTHQGENQRRIMSEKTRGYKNPMARPVRCIETGVIFKTGREASLAMGLSYSAVGMCLCGKVKSCGGFHWEYVDEKHEEGGKKRRMAAGLTKEPCPNPFLHKTEL
jgi:hypothetical protein